jgi:hypothetical protein
MSGPGEYDEDLQLARDAVAGDHVAIKKVNQLFHPIIKLRTLKLCKDNCRGNNRQYECSADVPNWGLKYADAQMCSWGNGSYAWMLEYLRGRLPSYKGEGPLEHYVNTIAHSRIFESHWRNFRNERRIEAPLCIRQLGADAEKLYKYMVDEESTEHLAQKLHWPVDKTAKLKHAIVAALVSNNMLDLLDRRPAVSLTGLGKSNDDDQDAQVQTDVADDSDFTHTLDIERLRECISKLSAKDNFILKSLNFYDKEATFVLEALQQLGQSIKEGVPAEQTDRQQLYYHQRKIIASLARCMGVSA